MSVCLCVIASGAFYAARSRSPTQAFDSTASGMARCLHLTPPLPAVQPAERVSIATVRLVV